MPRPTTTSAAATTRTKKTMACPPMSLSMRAKVTKVRLAALSISSMHMNMIRTLRRTSRPMAPMVKTMAARPRYQAPERLIADDPSLSVVVLLLGVDRRRAAGQHDGADHGDDQQRGGGLEREQVGGEELLAQLGRLACRRRRAGDVALDGSHHLVAPVTQCAVAAMAMTPPG
jgi:hypothetical protein